MKRKPSLPTMIVLALLLLLIPSGNASALISTVIPPVDMFQWPWEQGSSWVALDAFDNGTKRLLNSPHNYHNGGAVDFAPHNNMVKGEDTSKFWVTAAAAGTVSEISSCHLKIDHGNGWVTEYQHLANFQVRLGQAVSRNQHLAIIANASSQPVCYPQYEYDIPHLHFTLRPNMRDATFSGWLISYDPLFNKTTFTKDGQSLGSYQPLSNNPGLQIALRDPITWDIVYIGTVDAYRYERWPFTLTESTKFTVTATPSTSGLSTLVLLLDANGNELARGSGALTSTQAAGNYFVQVQPEAGSGFYNLLLQKETVPEPTVPYVSTLLTPSSVPLGETALATISLGNVPATGYTSAEFTCTYDPALGEVSNVSASALFGPDVVVALNGPSNGSFILAIAGSDGNKATASGSAFTFNVKGLQAGQSPIECTARVSQGDNVLTQITSTGPTTLTILGNTPTATSVFTPTPITSSSPTPEFTPTPVASPTNTPPSTPVGSPTPTLLPPGGDWLPFINITYQFQFKYPPQSQIISQSATYAKLDLPITAGTNLVEKYMEAQVMVDPPSCHSTLFTPNPPETVVINGITFLKEFGADGTTGHLYKWVAYSTQQGTTCVSMDFVLKSVDPGVFTTPPPLYDEAAESVVFGQIIGTFAWFGAPPSPTPTSTENATATPTTVPTSGTVTGKVTAGKPATIGLYDANNALIGSVTANSDGTFSLTAPAGTYVARASVTGYLSAQGNVTITGGGTSTLPPITLPAGDLDSNNVIDQFDAMTIGMNYNTAVPAAADLNNDGIINVLDLELLAKSYRLIGPVAWQ